MNGVFVSLRARMIDYIHWCSVQTKTLNTDKEEIMNESNTFL